MTEVKWHIAIRNGNINQSYSKMISEKRYGRSVPTCYKVLCTQITCRKWKKMPVAIIVFLSVYDPSPFPGSSCCSGAGACCRIFLLSPSQWELVTIQSKQFLFSQKSLVHTGRIKLAICVVMQLALCPIMSKLLQFYEQHVLWQWFSLCGVSGWTQSVKQLYTSEHPWNRLFFFSVSD